MSKLIGWRNTEASAARGTMYCACCHSMDLPETGPVKELLPNVNRFCHIHGQVVFAGRYGHNDFVSAVVAEYLTGDVGVGEAQASLHSDE